MQYIATTSNFSDGTYLKLETQSKIHENRISRRKYGVIMLVDHKSIESHADIRTTAIVLFQNNSILRQDSSPFGQFSIF
jgi:hypothetical protein